MLTPKGRFSWYELITSDTAAAATFYSAVVGWTTETMPTQGEAPAYTVFKLGESGMAGMLTLPGHSAWLGYVAVEAVDEHVEAIVQAGGKLLRPAQDVPGVLRFAVVADPQGAAFVVFTPNPAMPTPARPAPPAPGTIGWHELYTTDLEGGFSFYAKMFGWTRVTDIDMGSMGAYRLFDEGEGHAMGDGGMMLKGPHIPVSCWSFYLCVDSIKAAKTRVEEAGGKIVYGPAEVPGGAWIVQGMDPLGAMFALTGPE